jgi:hypothetical protein
MLRACFRSAGQHGVNVRETPTDHSGTRDADEVLDRQLLAACGRSDARPLEHCRRLCRRAAQHLRERLPEHLAPLLERGIHDREGAAPLLVAPPHLGVALEPDQHAVDVRHRPEDRRDTVPASRQGPYQAAFTLGAP